MGERPQQQWQQSYRPPRHGYPMNLSFRHFLSSSFFSLYLLLCTVAVIPFFLSSSLFTPLSVQATSTVAKYPSYSTNCLQAAQIHQPELNPNSLCRDLRRKNPSYYYEGCIAGVRYGYAEAAKTICSAEDWFPGSTYMDVDVDPTLGTVSERGRQGRSSRQQQHTITNRGAQSPSQRTRIYNKPSEKRNKDLDTVENIIESNPRKYRQYQKLSQSQKNQYVANTNLDILSDDHTDLLQSKDENKNNNEKAYKYIEGHYREKFPVKTSRRKNPNSEDTKEITIDGSGKCSKYHSADFSSPIGKEAEYISFHSKQAILDGCHVGYNSAYRKGFELLVENLAPLYPDLNRINPSTMLKDSQSYYQSAQSVYGPSFTKGIGKDQTTTLSSPVFHTAKSKETGTLSIGEKGKSQGNPGATISSEVSSKPEGKLKQGAKKKTTLVKDKPAKKIYNKAEQKKQERQAKMEAKRQKILAAKKSPEEYIKQYEERKYKREHRHHEEIKEIRQELREYSDFQEEKHFEEVHPDRVPKNHHSNSPNQKNKIREKELLINDNFNGKKYPTITVHIPQKISKASHVTYKGDPSSSQIMTTREESPSSLLAYKIPLIPNYPIEHSVVHWCQHNQPHEGSACARTVMRHMATDGIL